MRPIAPTVFASVFNFPEELCAREQVEAIGLLLQSVFDPSVLASMVGDGLDKKINANSPNKSFRISEFQELWHRINHMYAHIIDFDEDELRYNFWLC